MSDDTPPNWQTFDPTAGDEGAAMRARYRENFIKKRSRGFDKTATMIVLDALGASRYAPAVREVNRQSSGEAFLSVVAINQVLPSLPYWFASRRLSKFSSLKYCDAFNSPTRWPPLAAFQQAREGVPEVWRNRLVLVIGPLAGLRRRSRKLMVGYSRGCEPVNHRRFAMADHVIHLAGEDIVFRPATDFLRVLSETYQP